jgi:hypothetical protein
MMLAGNAKSIKMLVSLPSISDAQIIDDVQASDPPFQVATADVPQLNTFGSSARLRKISKLHLAKDMTGTHPPPRRMGYARVGTNG